ncbi:MAG: hypothetical protein GDA49_11760 [Rhodospirillales bacterium]|nr:hypothetical protein [Rhodospirillales bacterium]
MRLLIALLRGRPGSFGRRVFSKHDHTKQRNAASFRMHGTIALFLVVLIGCEAAQDPLPLPRFVSLKEDKVFMRAGPGTTYPINWVFVREGMPIEILREYEEWRYVRDHDGVEGWMHRIMLSGSRSVIVASQVVATAYDTPRRDGAPVFRADPGVQGGLISCDGSWCRIEIGDVKGWMLMDDLWGVYPEDGQG